MTDSDRNLSLTQYLDLAKQAIGDFDFADGLTAKASSHADYLALTAHGGSHAFEYRASEADLKSHGSGWFLRRALRSLNDRFVAGHLPQASGESEYEVLRPPDTYTAGG